MQMRSWRTAQIALLGGLLSLILLLAYQISKSVDSDRQELTAARPPDIKEYSNTESKAVAPAEPVAQLQAPRSSKSQASDLAATQLLANAWGSANPYALNRQLRDLRQEGSFAAATSIARSCKTAASAAHWLNAKPGAQNLPNYARRIEAQREIVARCQVFVEPDTMAAFTEPEYGDVPGARLKDALKTWLRYGASQKEVQASLNEFRQQGANYWLADHAEKRITEWEGVPVGPANALWSWAVQMALAESFPPPSSSGRDIRALRYCVLNGVCKDAWREVLLDVIPAKTEAERIQALRWVESLRENWFRSP